MKKLVYFFSAFFICMAFQLNAQQIESLQKATLIGTSAKMIEVPSIASQIADGTFLPAEIHEKEFNPKKWGSSTYIPGKGFPKGNDPLWNQQMKTTKYPGKAPILTYDAASDGATPTDPTGAVGPNHFINAWNSSFRIWDKAGNPLTNAAALGTILNGNAGDPIVFYDRYADRFIITEFYSNGCGMAVCQGPDPVNDGWYLYLFDTDVFPDYPKFSVWSDGYYITANKNSGSAGTSEVVYAVERDEMLVGNTSAQMVGFPLTDIVTSGFYSPLGFNCNGNTLPPVGNAPIVYMQDDAWLGVSIDHLKIWSINVNWTTPANSTISNPQILNTAAFDGLFDGGSFSNLPQPSGNDIDALQATIMYMAQYRRFAAYNSVVFNFVVDLDGNDDYSGIRWYELRQADDGNPWTIFQEGTYSQPDGHSAFSGNMCMDASGNIALAYTIVSTTINPSLRYTGRNAGDPLNTMTLAEEVIVNGTQVNPSYRYGDYSQMTIDPVDDATFWSIGEYFTGGSRVNRVGVFQIGPPILTADFSGTPLTICTGGSVTFTDQSLASPTIWNWSFPGGTPGSYNGQTPPAITYSTPGNYNVSLTVGDGIDTDLETKTNYITVQNIYADFTGSPTSVVKGSTVTFTDLSDCNPTSWSWTFPGGIPSSFIGQNPPPIQYDIEGSYDVTLSVTNASGSDMRNIPGYITVLPPEFNMQNGTVTTCEGNFYDSGGPSGSYSSNEDLVMTFYPSTIGEMIRFNFDSFATESGYDYLHIYNGENTSATLIGTYNGTTNPGMVTASNVSGALTFNFISDGSVTAAGWSASISCYSASDPPIADFSASSTSPSLNTDVVFTDLSINVPTSWSWSYTPSTVVFINGTDANSQNPEVQFTESVLYSVALTATNAYGSDEEIKTDYISVFDCSVTIYPYNQNFDGFILSSPDFACTADASVALSECWTNISGDNIDWDVLTGSTGSSATGPTTDHSGSGNYLYTESSSCFNNTGYITSPVFDLSSLDNPELNFWYHMYGAAMGTLSVQVSTDNGNSWSTNIWSLSGNQGDLWQEAIVTLSPYSSETDLIVRFAATTGADYTSDMAIDDFSIIDAVPPGDNCSNPQDLLSLISPYSATTVDYTNDFGFCGMGSAPDRIFFVDVPNGYTVEIWQSLNNFNSTHTMRYGGACPGNNEIGCIDDDDYTHLAWENLTGSTERIWFIVSGNGSDFGDFTLEWTLIPTSVPTCDGDIDIDAAGTDTWNYPLSTFYHDARTTSIYLASEFECAGGDVTAMQYYVSTVPGQIMNNFTIRMKHTTADSYTVGDFENTGWTTVYQANDTIPLTGWYIFNFSTPFAYNGLDNLEVDVSYNNDSYTTDGDVYYFDSGSNRSKYYRCDGCSFPTTDPLTWANTGSLISNVPRVIFTTESSINVDFKVFLEGPYSPSTNIMETNLNSQGFLPTVQPYNPPTPYYGNTNPIWQYLGTESVVSIPINVVDWVVVQLRDASSPANATSNTILGSQAGLLLSNGSIVATDGVSPLRFNVVVSQNLYAVVFHRNHLGVISNFALIENAGVYSYDFSSNEDQAFGGLDAHKELESGVWGMVAADGNADGFVLPSDETNVWLIDLNQSPAYRGGDFNLDGLGLPDDETNYWLPNSNKAGQIPGESSNQGYKSFVPK